MSKNASRSAGERLIHDPCADRDLSVAVPITDARLLDTLPKGLPEVIRLEFTLRGEGWPPKPRDAEQVRRLYAQEAPGALTDELERQLRETALRDDRVLTSSVGVMFTYTQMSSYRKRDVARIVPGRFRPASHFTAITGRAP